ncbi:MAG TPA: hypothetical protein VGM50_22800 [Gemmatimonadaceae bacterium]
MRRSSLSPSLLRVVASCASNRTALPTKSPTPAALIIMSASDVRQLSLNFKKNE